MIRLAHLLAGGSTTHNVQSEVLNEIHKSAGTRHYTDFDIDYKTWDDIRPLVETMINPEALHVLESRGGLHLLVEHAKIAPQFTKTWHRSFSSLPGVDVRGDNLIPVPGTIQGMHTPKLWALSHEFNRCAIGTVLA